MDIEIRKNVPLPDSREGGSLPPGRSKSKLRVAVEQLEVGDSFEMGPYTSRKVAEKNESESYSMYGASQASP